MNPVNLPVGSSAVPWPTSDDRARSSSGAVLPVREENSPPASALVMNSDPGIHHTNDHSAALVAPSASQRDIGLAAAEESLHTQPHQPAEARNDWLGRLRNTVCGRPLMSVAAAMALGAAVVRITR